VTTEPELSGDEAWLLAREEGGDAAPPSAETGQAYEALAREIEALPAIRAPAGWRDKMLAALDAEAPVAPSPAAPTPITARSRRRWWLVAVPLAAAAAALLYWNLHRRGGAEIALHVEVRAGDSVRRAGDAPAVGDHIVARVVLDEPGELRIYRNDVALMARCPGHRACGAPRKVDGGEELSVDLPMTARGEYRALVIAGVRDLPLTGSLDGDARAARERGARVAAGRAIGAR
jgi:hypothetical protein